MTQSIETVPPPHDPDAVFREGLKQMRRILGSRRIFAALTAAAEVDLSQQAVDVLVALQDGATRSIGDVARVAGLDAGAVSRQLNQLEAAGYAHRDGAGRGSVVLVTATSEGRALVARVEAVRQAHLARALSGWTAEEREQLGTLLVRLADDLHRAPFRPVPEAPTATPARGGAR